MKKRRRIFLPGVLLLGICVLSVCILFARRTGTASANVMPSCPYHTSNECYTYDAGFAVGRDTALGIKDQTGSCPTNHAYPSASEKTLTAIGYYDGWNAEVDNNCPPETTPPPLPQR